MNNGYRKILHTYGCNNTRIRAFCIQDCCTRALIHVYKHRHVYIRVILHVYVTNSSIGKSYTRMGVIIHVYVYFVYKIVVHVH